MMSINYFSGPVEARDLISFDYSSSFPSKESSVQSLPLPSYFKPTSSSFRAQKLDSTKSTKDSHLSAPWSPESKPPSFSPQYLPVHEKTIQYREQQQQEFDMFSLGEAAAMQNNNNNNNINNNNNNNNINNNNNNREDEADGDCDADVDGDIDGDVEGEADAEGSGEFDFSQLAQESVMYPIVNVNSNSNPNHLHPLFHSNSRLSSHSISPSHSRSPSHSHAPAPFNISIEQAESQNVISHSPDLPHFIHHHRHNASFSSQATDDDSRGSDEMEGGEQERDEIDETGSVVDLDFNLRFNEEQQEQAKRMSGISSMLPITSVSRSITHPTHHMSSGSASLCVPSLWQRRAVQRSNSASVPSSTIIASPPQQHHQHVSQPSSMVIMKMNQNMNINPTPPPLRHHKLRIQTTGTPHFLNPHSPLSSPSSPVSPPYSPRSSSSSSSPSVSPLSSPPFSSYSSPSSSACSTPTMGGRREDFDHHVPRIGTYTPMERALKIQRYHEKRQRRQWGKKILYGCRKSFADKRPRVGGRFVKMAPASTTNAANTPTTVNATTKKEEPANGKEENDAYQGNE